MAIGDDALLQNYPLVPDNGLEGMVKYGAREINRTRDFIALVKKLIPVGGNAFRVSSGISSGTGDPAGGNDGDIYFKVVQ